MVRDVLRMSMENDRLEEHLAALLEKVEAIREVRKNVSPPKYRQPIQVEIRTLEFWRSIISECLASFFFVFIVSGVGLGFPNKGTDKTNELTLATAFATGLAMMVLHQCFGKISGGHVNPAVSLAMAVTKKITPLRGSLFVLAQCGGGIAGAALLYGVTPSGPHPAVSLLALGPWERFGVELVLTFIVVFTHFSTLEKINLDGCSAVIGSAYGACTVAGMPMLNPARALGPAFVMNKLWDNHWVCWFGPVLGGIVAAIIHEFIFNAKRNNKRLNESSDGDSSSIHSEDEPFEDNKYHPAAYRPVGQGNSTSPGGYCPSVASTSVYSSPPGRIDRHDSSCTGSRLKGNSEGIYSGTRSLYGVKVTDGLYAGTKSMYTKSPPLTRANLNRSQSVYSKSQNPRDLFPKPGPLVPAQSLYPIKLGNESHLNANIRDFGPPIPNFISGVKTTAGNFIKLPQTNDPMRVTNFNQNALNFLAGRNATSKSYHDISEPDKSSFQQDHNFSATADHLANQNAQNQHLLNSKPDKEAVENIYGVRNCTSGGIYSGNEVVRSEVKRELQQKRESYDLIPRSQDNGGEVSRNHTGLSFNRTAAYVKSVQNNPNFKARTSNYDVVPGGIREVPNFNQKPQNRSDTSDYGSNSLTNQFSE